MKFEHKKSLGQNFLSDTNLLSAIANDAGVTKEDNVLEIGPGLGSLTAQLAKRANKVLAVETDQRLVEPLTQKFEAIPNVSFIFKDFMQVEFSEIEEKLGSKYIVVANLPYYITTPILFRFFTEQNGATKVVVMVQKEVAERMAATPGGKDYGLLSVACQHMGKTKILRQVGRKNFNPVPNVDSAFVAVELSNKKPNDEFFDFAKDCFSMRRKTLSNNLKGKVDLQKLFSALKEMGHKETARAEELLPEEIAKLQFLSKNNKK